jgi:type IX secretion system PorP/SprF family membrane protein
MKKFLIILGILAVAQLSAQDVIFSQNFLVPETLNSSFTGAIKTSKIGSIHRSQWRNYGLKTNSNYFYYDTWLEGIKTGIGITLLNHTESASSYQFNQVNLNYSLSFQINDTWFFRPSISAGFGIKNYGFQNLLLEDQINLNSNSINTSSIDPLLLREKRMFFDFSSSLLFNNENSWIGLTLKHLNKPNISLAQNGNIPLDIFISIHAKYYIPILENRGTWITSKSKIYFLSNFMLQGSFNRLDLGVQYIFNEQFSLGLITTSSPLSKRSNNSSLITSVNSFAGISWQGFRFGYSYDFKTSEIANTGGTHEFSLSYDFSKNIRFLNRFKCVPYF